TVIPNIADSVVGRPSQITVGSDGALWYTLGIGQVGRMDLTGHQITTPLTGGPAGPFYASFTSITTGPDGELWTTDYSNSIYFIPPVFAAGGGGQLSSIVEIPLSTSFNLPNRIATGPDGNLWF